MPEYNGVVTDQGGKMAANGGLDRTALALVTVGGINWGLVGLFDFDLVAKLFGNRSVLSRTVYGLVGAGAVYTLGRVAASSE